jgi:serine/threonine protein kinase
VYAFGVIVWELLTNRHPFALHADDIRRAHSLIPPLDPRTVNSSADPTLSQIAMECLSKNAEARLRHLGVTRARENSPVAGPHVDRQVEGLRLFEEALATGRAPITLFNYAQALRMTGRHSDALTVVQELLVVTPDDPYAQAMLRELQPPAVH